MSILIVLFGLLSDCLLSVLVGIIGSSRRIGFGLAFLVSLIFVLSEKPVVEGSGDQPDPVSYRFVGERFLESFVVG